MQLDTLAIPRDQAREAYLRYESELKARSFKSEPELKQEMEAIRDCYKEIASNRQVINILDTIKLGGLIPEQNLPRLALARAHWRRCFVSYERDGNLRFRDQSFISGRHSWRHFQNLPKALPPHQDPRWTISGQTIVPSIPPQFLPPLTTLHRYHILFEVEKWEPAAPVDPALLKHLGGALYAVLHVWDLTPVERAVLGMTRR